MKVLGSALLVLLASSLLPAFSDEPVATEAPKEAASTATSANATLVEPDSAMTEAKQQEATLNYSHDAFKKSRMSMPANMKGAALLAMMDKPISKLAKSQDEIGYTNYGTIALDLSYECKKSKAMSILDELDASATKAYPQSYSLIGNALYYFAIGCYCDNDMDNAEKYGLKSIDKYVTGGSTDFMDTSNLKIAYYMLALIKEKQGKQDDALSYARKGKSIAN